MSAYPYKSSTVYQIHPDGWGWNDCAEGSSVRLVREAGQMDPSGDHLVQIDQMCRAMRGTGDSPDNGYTYSDQIVAGLAKYGINAHWSDSYQEAHDAPWSLVVVSYEPMLGSGGYAYPPSALGGGTHVCLWMPDGFVNDPLSVLGLGGDVRWDSASLQSVWVGAIVIETQVGPQWPALPPPPPPVKPVAVKRQTVRECGLKPSPAHGGPNLISIPQGSQVLDTGNRNGGWASICYGTHGKGYWGWVPQVALNLKQAG